MIPFLFFLMRPCYERQSLHCRRPTVELRNGNGVDPVLTRRAALFISSIVSHFCTIFQLFDILGLLPEGFIGLFLFQGYLFCAVALLLLYDFLMSVLVPLTFLTSHHLRLQLGMDGEELTEQETALYDRQIRVWGVDAQRRYFFINFGIILKELF